MEINLTDFYDIDIDITDSGLREVTPVTLTFGKILKTERFDLKMNEFQLSELYHNLRVFYNDV